MNRILYTLLLIIFSYPFAEAQISGRITSKSNEPIIGANIQILETEEGTVSNVDGEFEFNHNERLNVTISYLGYHDTTLILSPNYQHEIVLSESNIILSCPIFIEDKYYAAYGFSNLKSLGIEKIDIQNPANLYNMSPGLFMHSGALNTNRLTIRGIGSRSPFSTKKIKAYLNNIPLTNGVGETNLEDINLAIVDEINIYKGPTMPRFGAGLGGVVHYRTYSHKRFKNSITNTTSFASFNSIHNNINYNYAQEGILFSLNNDFLKSEGYRENNNYQRQNISGFAQADFDNDVLSIFVNHTLLEAQIPSGLNIQDFELNPSLAAANWKSAQGYEDYNKTQVGITHQRTFKNDWSSSVTGFINTLQNYERRPFNVLTQNAKAIGTRFEVLKDFWDINSKMRFGGELFSEFEEWSTYETLEIGQGNILSDNFEKRNYFNLFTEWRYMWNRFNLDFGLNFNSTRFELLDRFIADGEDQSGNYNFDPTFSPFVSFSYQKLSKLIYTTFSHGFSAPTLEETLTPSGLINLDIQPETGWNLEFGYKEAIRNFYYDFTLYNMWVENLLVAERVTEDQFIGVNAGKSMHPGLEAEIGYQRQKGNKNFKIQSSYQYQPHHFTEFVNRDIDFAGKRLPGNPDHKLNTFLEYSYNSAHIKVSNLFVSKMFADDNNSIEVESYNITNVSLSYNLLKKNGWEIFTGFNLNNIFDIHYASMISVNPRSFGTSLPRYLYAGLPRNFKITLQLKYSFS